jgi:hypothetical protein
VKTIKLKTRSYVARQAWDRNGAGQHRDQKAHAKRQACRGRVVVDD